MRRAVRSLSLGLPGLLLLGLVSVASAQSGRAWLGVTTQSVTEELRDALDLRGDGVLVNSVAQESPADRAGIRKGDVITSVNGRSVESPEELASAIQSQAVGSNVSVRLARRSGTQTLNIRLAARPGFSEPRADDDEEDGDRWETPAPTPRADTKVRAWKDGKEVDPDDLDSEMPNLRGLRGLEGMNGFQWNSRPRLGVRLQEMNSDLGSYFGGTNGRGALVVEVIEDTPAEKAGLRAGDVITAVGSTNVDDTDDLMKAIADEEGTVSLTFVRKGVRKTVEAELGDAPRNNSNTWRMRDGRAPRAPRAPQPPRRFGDSSSDEDREMQELRDEIRELKKQLEEERDR